VIFGIVVWHHIKLKKSETTTVAAATSSVTEITLDGNSTLDSNSTDNDTSIIKKTLDDFKQKLDFDQTRLLHSYCKLEGLMRDLIFGRNEESEATPVMLAVLIVSSVLFLLYILTTILAFHNARRVDSTQFNSW